jgi:RsmE family RNA methyltransferase
VNLLLVESEELAPDMTCMLTGRRADHLRNVLKVVVGQRVRAGVVGGRIGTAEVLADEAPGIRLRVVTTMPSPPLLPVELVLAIPRPKVLTRVIEIAAAFAVARIELTNAWRVEKSYLGSPRLASEALGEALRRGAEQSGTTHVAPLEIHDRLMSLLDGRWPASRDASARAGTRLLAHPGAAPIETVALTAPVVLAIGPEGGWIPREVETFVERGFTPVSIGAPILRVEAAVAAALGQLLLLLRQRG